MTPTAIALGNFDGVHLGHQAVIGQVLPGGVNSPERVGYGCKVAHPSSTVSRVKGYSHWNASTDADTESHRDQSGVSGAIIPTVVTFFPHPQEFFSGQSRPLLTPLEEKAAQISRLGIGQLVLLPFNRELAALSPEEFVDILLIEQLKARHISVGKDFCFGKNRAGTVDDLNRLASRHGVEVSLAPLRLQGTERISSSRIRAALLEGNLETARALLGRPYSICGRVVRGQQLGRTLGFPTANLKPPADKFLPKYGVYSVWVQGVSGTPEQFLPGVLNIGVRPTVDGLATTVEVHLLTWSGDLYGKSLGLILHDYLRPEQKFASLDALKDQIQQDCQAALASLAKPE